MSTIKSTKETEIAKLNKSILFCENTIKGASELCSDNPYEMSKMISSSTRALNRLVKQKNVLINNQ